MKNNKGKREQNEIITSYMRNAAITTILCLCVAVAVIWRYFFPDDYTAHVELPVCIHGKVAIAWSGDGQKIGCIENIEMLLLKGAEKSRCIFKRPESDRLEAEDSDGKEESPKIEAEEKNFIPVSTEPEYSLLLTESSRRLMPGDRINISRKGKKCVFSVDSISAAERLALGIPIDINKACKEDLMLLRGIGPTRARAIIEDREAGGYFTTVEDLKRVRGIGPITVQRISPYTAVYSCDGSE